MKKKLLDFQASISDVKQINPLFSTCKVRVLYTGKNRNMSTITKDAVEKALPTLKNIPIVGEFSVENEDFKGHGGAIDLDSYRFIHTTKPYGVVPESATYEWVQVKGRDGATHDYLEVDGCYLWTGRYEEAYSVIEQGKGQSMEIEITDGHWDDVEESYVINNFTFSALCILGDNVEPAFEDASITAYSFNKDSFKQEFTQMLGELKSSLSPEKGVNEMDLKQLLEKYSLTMEDLTAKGIKLDEISEDELETKIIEVFEIEVDDNQDDNAEDNNANADNQDDNKDNADADQNNEDDNIDENGANADDNTNKGEQDVDLSAEIQRLQRRVDELEGQLSDYEALKEFKLNAEKAEHEDKAQKLFSDFQLTEDDVKDLDIYAFSMEEIEEKCFAILGRKLKSKKEFSKDKNGSIRLPLGSDNNHEEQPKPYGGLFEKYNK